MTNEWNRYQELVLSKLKNLEEGQDKIEDRLSKIEIEIAMLKIKSSVWGAIGGSIPVLIMILIEFLRKN